MVVKSSGEHATGLRTTNFTNVNDTKWRISREDDLIYREFEPPVTQVVTVISTHTPAPTVPPAPAPVSLVKGNPDICHASKKLKWIIYVHTAPKNIKKRNTIRETWGNKYLFEDRRTAIIFLVGLPRDDAEKKIIDREYKRYGDLVQGDFIDHYRNLTYKGILGLHFIADHCSHVPYAIKTDDDVFTNIFKIIQLTRKQGPDQRLLMCNRWYVMPIRRRGGDPSLRKWWLDDNILPGQRLFPPYCAGLGWVFSTNIVKELLEKCKSTPFLWIDDVYISGVVMNQVSELNIVNLLRIVPRRGVQGELRYFDSNKYIFSHKVSAKIREFWDHTLHQLDHGTLRELNATLVKQYPVLIKKRRNMLRKKKGNLLPLEKENIAHLILRH